MCSRRRADRVCVGDEGSWWIPDPEVEANHEHRTYSNPSAQRAETSPMGPDGSRRAPANRDPPDAARRPALLPELEQPRGRRLGRRGDGGALAPVLHRRRPRPARTTSSSGSARGSRSSSTPTSNLLGRVTTRVSSGRLVIGTTPGNLSAKSPMFVAVSVPSLDRRPASRRREHRRDRDRQPEPDRGAPGERQHRRDRNDDEARRDDQRRRDGSAARVGRARREMLRSAATAASCSPRRAVSTARISGSGTIFYGGNPAHVTPMVTGSGTISPG